MKAPTTIQTRYTVNFCEPRRWEKVSSLERDMNHNIAMKGRRPNRDDEINNRPVNKKISHIGCTILDWNNAFDPQQSIYQMNWIQLEWMMVYLIPVKFHALSFSNISGTLSNLTDFLGSLETEMHYRSQQMRWWPKKGKPGWIHFIWDNTLYFLWDCFHCEF